MHDEILQTRGRERERMHRTMCIVHREATSVESAAAIESIQLRLFHELILLVIV